MSLEDEAAEIAAELFRNRYADEVFAPPRPRWVVSRRTYDIFMRTLQGLEPEDFVVAEPAEEATPAEVEERLFGGTTSGEALAAYTAPFDELYQQKLESYQAVLQSGLERLMQDVMALPPPFLVMRVDELLPLIRSEHQHTIEPKNLAPFLAEDGMLHPVVLRGSPKRILCIDDGNTRLKAAALLGWEWVPVVFRA